MPPPTKGGVRCTVRVRRLEHLEFYDQEAARLGVSRSEYLEALLGAAYNVTAAVEAAARDLTTEQLPLQEAGDWGDAHGVA